MDGKTSEDRITLLTNNDSCKSESEFACSGEGGLSSLQSGQLEQVDSSEDSHTVLTTFPANVDDVGSSNHIHLHLLDGQVIHITSASLVSGEGRDKVEADVQDYQEGERQDDCTTNIAGGEEGGGGGTALTFLTADGKTYILPQSLNSDDVSGGGYLIPEEVLASDAILRPSDQVLRFSIPQSSRKVPQSAVRLPDPLAIATSQVFNEGYESLSLDPHSAIDNGSQPFQIEVKVSEEESSENREDCLNPQMLIQREISGPSECSLNASHTLNDKSKNQYSEKKGQENVSPIFTKPEIYKSSVNGNDTKEDHYESYCKRDSSSSTSVQKNAMSIAETLGADSIVGTHKSDQGVYSKFCELSDSISYSNDDECNITKTSERVAQKHDIKNVEGSDSAECQEKSSANGSPVSLEYPDCANENKNQASGVAMKLRRSSRIRKAKKITSNEEEECHLVEESSVKKSRSGMKLETKTALWDCIKCDAMFRTKVSRDRHMQEGHFFSCFMCGWQGLSKSEYELHISTVHCQQQARCLQCRKNFGSYEDFKNHMKAEHSLIVPAKIKTESEDNSKREKEENCKKEGDEEDPDNPKEPDNPKYRMEESRHHGQEGRFSCFMCGWQGLSQHEYEAHISTVHCQQEARCLQCRKNFGSYEDYKHHMKTDHSVVVPADIRRDNRGGSKKEKGGEDCKEEGDDEEDPDDPEKKLKKVVLSKTMDSSTVSDDHQCPYCGKQFMRQSRFLRHINYHLGNRAFSCEFCSKSFVEKSGLNAHYLTHTPLNEECPHCHEVFKTQRTMKRHLRTHRNLSHKCNVCGKEFGHEESLRVHRFVHRKGGSGNICNLCQKDCKTPYYLQLHMSTKHEAAKYFCRPCNRSFKWKQSHRKHMAINHGDAFMKYQCPMCPRQFLTMSERRAHEVVHSDERKFLCDKCGKAFKHEYTRDKHVKTVHQEEREHMCPQCGALFKAKAYLDQHLSQVHTTKDRVKCAHCGHDFKTEMNLKSHMKKVHNPRNPKYSCEKCNKAFFAPKDLTRHLKVHSGVKDYVCPICRHCFSRKDNMAAHLRTHSMEVNAASGAPHGDLLDAAKIPQQSSEEVAIISLPSNVSSASDIILSNAPPSADNITLSNVAAHSSNISPSDVSHGPVNAITLSDTGISSGNLAFSNIPVSTANVVLSKIANSSNNLILSNISISSSAIAWASIPSSGNAVVFSTAGSLNNIDSSSTQAEVTNALCHTPSGTKASSSKKSMLSCNSVCSSITSIDSSSSCKGSSNNCIKNICNKVSDQPSNSGLRSNQEAFNIHPHIITPAQQRSPSVLSLPQSSPSSSLVLSIPTHSTSSSTIDTSSPHPNTLSDAALQPDHVMLTTEVLRMVPPLSPLHSATTDQHAELTPLGSSTLSGTTVTTVDSSVSPSGTGDPHTGTGSLSLTPGMILPSSSLLHEATLILPEKTGVYTMVDEGGKVTPLESFTLHPGPLSQSSSHHTSHHLSAPQIAEHQAASHQSESQVSSPMKCMQQPPSVLTVSHQPPPKQASQL